MLLPKPAEVSDEATADEKIAAIAKLSVSYSLTTLQAFDKAVTKATCNTTVELAGVEGQPPRAQLSFEVAPAAEDPNKFIVSAAATDQLRAEATLVVRAALGDAAKVRAQQEEDIQKGKASIEEAQREARVRAIVSDRWLRGVWMRDDSGPETCATDAAVRFMGNNLLAGSLGTGRWALTGTEVHLVGMRDGQAIDERYTFSSADAVSGSASMPDSDAGFSLRRCAPGDIRPPSAVRPETEGEGAGQ
jgi:hypothetical protein